MPKSRSISLGLAITRLRIGTASGVQTAGISRPMYPDRFSESDVEHTSCILAAVAFWTVRNGPSSQGESGDKYVVEGFQISAIDLAVRFWLHVRHVDDHGSPFREYDDALPAEPSCVVSSLLGLPDDPPEQAVVVVWVADFGFERRRFGALADPVRRHDSLAVPDSVAPVQLPDLHHVWRCQPQTESAQLDAVGVGAPTEAGRDGFGRKERIGKCLGEGRPGRDAQRIEEFLPGVVENCPRTVAVGPF